MNPKPWLEECCFLKREGGCFVFKLWEKLPHTAGQRNVYLITFCLLSLRLSHVNSHLTNRERERDWEGQREREKHYISALVKRNVGSLQWDALNPCEKRERRGKLCCSYNLIHLEGSRQWHLFKHTVSITFTPSKKSLSLQKTTGGNVTHRWAALHALTPITSSTWHNINTLILATHTHRHCSSRLTWPLAWSKTCLRLWNLYNRTGRISPHLTSFKRTWSESWDTES